MIIASQQVLAGTACVSASCYVLVVGPKLTSSGTYILGSVCWMCYMSGPRCAELFVVVRYPKQVVCVGADLHVCSGV